MMVSHMHLKPITLSTFKTWWTRL
jgi:hypothetical protein